VDVLDVKELTLSAPQADVNQILNYAAPSFTANTQTISDGTDHIDPAALRGLGPDQVLVLINGKRRHKTSLVNVNGTFGRGSVGTDMNSIPSHAIDRIEILRDGAAAQYGSDAIAGVINVVLKKSTDLSVVMHTGANFTKNEDEMTGLSDNVTDGEKVGVALNYGLPIGENGGYINFTGSFDYRGRTNRMLEWEGSIFNQYNAVERAARNAGYDTSLLLDDDLADIFTYAGAAGISLTGTETLEELQDILGTDATESELNARGLERSDFNMNVGQSELRNSQFFANMSIPLGNDTEIYAFGGLGYRDGNATGFYRLPNQNRTYTPAYPNGFLPQIHSNIIDKSLAVGIRGKLGDWDIDFSNTYGRNSFEFNIRNSSNASMQNSTPFEVGAGGFAYGENTINFDVSQFFDDIMSGLNIAFGAEYRLENYEIIAGVENSYAQYNTLGNVHDPTDPDSEVPTDFLGRSRPGGIQVFPGFRPENERNEFRNSIAGYFDVEADFSETFLMAAAIRYENYSDFGGTFNGKLATRIKAGDNFNIRAGLQTGFRAPSLHQIHFNSTSTLFVDGIPFEVGVFPNTSRIARILGIEQLKEETSFGATLGFTANIPDANMKITVDGYITNIDDRVIETGQFTDNDDPELATLFAQANAERVGFFANAVDTETSGIDFVIDHSGNLNDRMRLKNTLAFTFSDTEIKNINIPSAISDADLDDTFFDPTSRIYIESAVPRVKGNLLHSLYWGDNWTIFLRNAYFGEVTEATNQENPAEYGGKIVTDLTFGYQFSDNTRLTFGANNLFDVYSDQTPADFRSSGRFIYSRRSQQFGTNGRYLFARLNFTIN
jgi:iron complex outermembrane receptor protein